MADFSVHKVLDALPSPLEANAVYAVRTGDGFDLYITNDEGTFAHKINSEPGPASPIFETAAEADAWSLANPGKVAFARNAS